MKEEVLIDNEFFKATRTELETEKGPAIEYGLSWSKSIEDTIKELIRLYKQDK